MPQSNRLKSKPGKKTRARDSVPFSKATRATVEERIDYVENILRYDPVIFRSVLVNKIKKEFGVEWRVASAYLAKAKARLILRIKQTKDELRADAVAFYEGVIDSPMSRQQDRIAARKRIDDMLGLDAPPPRLQIEHSGQVSGFMDVESLGLSLECRKELLQALRLKQQQISMTPAVAQEQENGDEG